MHSKLIDKFVDMDKLFKEWNKWKVYHAELPSKYQHPFQHCAFKQFNEMTYMVPKRQKFYPEITNDKGDPITLKLDDLRIGEPKPRLSENDMGPPALSSPNVAKTPRKYKKVAADTSIHDTMLFM